MARVMGRVEMAEGWRHARANFALQSYSQLFTLPNHTRLRCDTQGARQPLGSGAHVPGTAPGCATARSAWTPGTICGRHGSQLPAPASGCVRIPAPSQRGVMYGSSSMAGFFLYPLEIRHEIYPPSSVNEVNGSVCRDHRSL